MRGDPKSARRIEKLSFADKISRLNGRLRDPEWRRYGKFLLIGKLTGIGLLILAGILFNPDLFGLRVFAADTVLKGNDIVNPINTVWTLIAAFLVFGMQVGFTMLEAGFCRSRETVNVLMECIVDTCLCGLLFYALGFAFMFSHGNGFIGHQLVLPARTHRRRTKPPAWRSWRSGCSSLRLPIPARRSPRAR